MLVQEDRSIVRVLSERDRSKEGQDEAQWSAKGGERSPHNAVRWPQSVRGTPLGADSQRATH